MKNAWITKDQPGLLTANIWEETGEIFNVRPSVKRKKIEKQYYVMIFDFTELVKRLSGKALETFTLLTERAEYGTNRVELSSGFRKTLSSKMSTPVQNISKYIKEIKDKDLIRHIEYDDWIINPTIVWKGDLNNKCDAEDYWNRLLD